MLLVSEAAAEHLVDLAPLGSQGCVSEDALLEDLRAALRVVLSGRPYCSPHLANALFAQLRRVDQGHRWGQYAEDARLTAREREILRMITLEHLANKQIARRLHVSLYTVKNHVHNILEKLGVEDRYRAAQLARSRRLVADMEASP
jgi:DNA-binding NarL/FixJ family response regulator